MGEDVKVDGEESVEDEERIDDEETVGEEDDDDMKPEASEGAENEHENIREEGEKIDTDTQLKDVPEGGEQVAINSSKDTALMQDQANEQKKGEKSEPMVAKDTTAESKGEQKSIEQTKKKVTSAWLED